MTYLTIIAEDSSIGKGEQKTNKLFFDEFDLSTSGIPDNVHALQWDGSAGEIEFNDGTFNQTIAELPSWAVACDALWQARKYDYENPAPLTDEQQTLANKNRAKSLLADSDWAALPDTNLSNQTEWDSYRAALRSIFLNPTPDASFPTIPDAIWA